jgi:hypothetical protein
MRIDQDVKTGHIFIDEWLTGAIIKERWAEIINGIDLWFSDREILTYSYFSPLNFRGGEFYRHDVGSHKTLRQSALGSWSTISTMMTLNDCAEVEPSATVALHNRGLITRVKNVHITAHPNELLLYLPDVSGGTFQAFEFKPRLTNNL